MGNFVQAARVVVPPQLTQGMLIEPVQYITELLVVAGICREVFAICLAKRADKRIAVLSADLSMLVAVAIV
jgi:hypothetical protein